MRAGHSCLVRELTPANQSSFLQSLEDLDVGRRGCFVGADPAQIVEFQLGSPAKSCRTRLDAQASTVPRAGRNGGRAGARCRDEIGERPAAWAKVRCRR